MTKDDRKSLYIKLQSGIGNGAQHQPIPDYYSECQSFDVAQIRKQDSTK